MGQSKRRQQLLRSPAQVEVDARGARRRQRRMIHDKRVLNKLARDPNSWYSKYKKLRAETRGTGGAVQCPTKGLATPIFTIVPRMF